MKIFLLCFVWFGVTSSRHREYFLLNKCTKLLKLNILITFVVCFQSRDKKKLFSIFVLSVQVWSKLVGMLCCIGAQILWLLWRFYTSTWYSIWRRTSFGALSIKNQLRITMDFTFKGNGFPGKDHLKINFFLLTSIGHVFNFLKLAFRTIILLL